MIEAAACDTALPDAATARTAVVLCAGWCRTCDAYRAVFEALRAAHPEVRWHWVDIEDEAELVDDIDVQTFPTLVLVDGGRPWFAGPVLPKADVVLRLLAQPAGAARGTVEDAEAFGALVAALQRRR